MWKLNSKVNSETSMWACMYFFSALYVIIHLKFPSNPMSYVFQSNRHCSTFFQQFFLLLLVPAHDISLEFISQNIRFSYICLHATHILRSANLLLRTDSTFALFPSHYLYSIASHIYVFETTMHTQLTAVV